MDFFDDMQIEEIICAYMEYGDDFHESVEKIAKKKDIQTGAILSGAGTFDKARIHYITKKDFPAEDTVVTKEGPIELCSVDGIIADYKPHMHCTMAIWGNGLFSGHLEPGCNVLYLAEVVMAKFSGKKLERNPHSEYTTDRLQEK